eukprot:TRINITY_DN14096_c0_g1_i1.p1 TRINITY_DN14096_c0_g1~~TRINITY_DN14096_c0_g1_i1.p1  ORF type:complete len:889 (-),score=209.11 TRINITY_DN14096_c0_g1_i1:341-2959(-)
MRVRSTASPLPTTRGRSIPRVLYQQPREVVQSPLSPVQTPIVPFGSPVRAGTALTGTRRSLSPVVGTTARLLGTTCQPLQPIFAADAAAARPVIAAAPAAVIAAAAPPQWRGRSQSPQRTTVPAAATLGSWSPLKGLETPRPPSVKTHLQSIGRRTMPLPATAAMILPVHRAQSSTSVATGAAAPRTVTRVKAPDTRAADAAAPRSLSPTRGVVPLQRAAAATAKAPAAAVASVVRDVYPASPPPTQRSPATTGANGGGHAHGAATPEVELLACQEAAPPLGAGDDYAAECVGNGGSVLPIDSNSSEPVEHLERGAELTVGEYRLRVLDVLGSGSYSVVWLAEVVGPAEVPSHFPNGGAPPLVLDAHCPPGSQVALKDVVCRSHASLRQSLFEVQLLYAVERASTLKERLRLPRCCSYRVGVVEGGWCVRTVMTRLPGEQLDDWLRRAATIASTPAEGEAEPARSLAPWTSHFIPGARMAGRLIRQVGPTLEQLAPLAWHRDVNSHNLLVSDAGTDAFLSPDAAGDHADFTLCDLGLAVDAQSWGSADGAWRVTDIGGDCRYWPASSWMVHLYGADYLATQEDFCRQYQTRLDIHGLGITAIEILCTVASAARDAGAPREAPGEESTSAAEGRGDGLHWDRLLDAWEVYHKTVGSWWEMIYSIFSVGGDFRPVHSWLVEQCATDKVEALIAELRRALRECADNVACSATASVLRVLADLADEASTMELSEACQLLEPAEASGVPATNGRAAAAAQPSACAPATSPGGEAGLAQAQQAAAPALPTAAAPACEVLPDTSSRDSIGQQVAELQNYKCWVLQDFERLQQVKLRLTEYARQIGEGCIAGPRLCEELASLRKEGAMRSELPVLPTLST